jgi:hypothetical protein
MLRISPLGTSFILYGTVAPTTKNGPPVSSYSIDNGMAIMYTAPSTNSTLYQQPFHEAHALTAEEHILTVTVKSTSEYWLDYALVTFLFLFVYRPILTRVLFLQVCTDSNNTSRPDSHSGAIVGGILGGVLFTLVTVLLGFWYRRQRQKHKVETASFTRGFSIQPGKFILYLHSARSPLTVSKLCLHRNEPRGNKLSFPIRTETESRCGHTSVGPGHEF